LPDFLSFGLSDEFIAQYAEKPVPWGLKDAGGTSLSEIVFLRTYSRRKEDGTKEQWHEVCRRVVEGTFSIQKDWAKSHYLPWNDHKAARSAQEMYRRMFDGKWTPPGRGIQNMGTYMINGLGYSTALQNCGAISTGEMIKTDPGEPFSFAMSASMMGVGMGFDTKGAEKGFRINQPSQEKRWTYVVPDTREGWAEATRLLINSHLIQGKDYIDFDYSEIRPKGALIKTFGTPAPGPEPLKKLHNYLRLYVFGDRQDSLLTSRDVVDIMNLIGKCVVSGNTRRSALLAYGNLDDKDFVNLKNWRSEENVLRMSGNRDKGIEPWGHGSNNSVRAMVTDDLSGIAEAIQLNGEPGIIWEDVVKNHGRLIDPPDDKDKDFAVFNPCAEQPLNSREFCTLVDVYADKHEDFDDFQQTLKYAFLYAKSVTLLPTHFERSNSVMQRNRRIGTSLSGIANFIDNRVNGLRIMREWFDKGYQTIRRYDKTYSEWLCVRESNRVTTIKPGGTTGQLMGTSSGIHWTEGGEYYMRTVRMQGDDPLVQPLRDSGHRVEADVTNANDVVVYFPIKSSARRSANDVSVFEKAALAVEAQKLWSDNGVSVTLTYDPETETEHVPTILNMYAGQLKAVSFLAQDKGSYQQMPYSALSAEEFEAETLKLFPAYLGDIYAGNALDITEETGCTTDACEVKSITLATV
jgi:adenosylcobalamin-dependent ribonucleoside-triphosphate reductase